MRNDTVIDTAINELEALYGNGASDISRGLKYMNGNENLTIPQNLVRIFKLCKKEMNDMHQKDIIKFTIGTAFVIPTTVIITLTAERIIHKKRIEKQQNCEVIKKVIEALKQDVSLSNEEKLPEDENCIILDNAVILGTQTKVPELFPSAE